MSYLLRSTKLLKYITSAKRANKICQPVKNLFFNDIAACSVINVSVRDYTILRKSKTSESPFDMLLNEVRNNGKLSRKDFDKICDEIPLNISVPNSLLAIRSCGELVLEELPTVRTQLVQKVWNLLRENKVPMDISHYNALLQVYIENEHSFSPAKFLEEIEKDGFQANRVTYQRLMWQYCKNGDLQGATKILEKMKELNYPVLEPVLNALVMGHSFHGDVNGANTVIETMKAAGLNPTNKTYALLACGYAKQGDMEAIENIIKTANETAAYLSDEDLLKIIEHLSIGGHVEQIESVIPYLKMGFGYSQDASHLIYRLFNKGHEKTAKRILQTIPKSIKRKDDLFQGAFFIRYYLKLNRTPEQVIEFCKELKKEELIPNSLFIAANYALKECYLPIAKPLFEELRNDGLEIREHYYWPLIAQKCKENDEEAVLQILRDMNAQTKVTGDTLKDYVVPFLLKHGSPQDVITKLQMAGISDGLSSKHTVQELLDVGKIKEAAYISNEYPFRSNINNFELSLVNALKSTGDIESFLSIVHVLSRRSDSKENIGLGNDVSRVMVAAIKTLKGHQIEELLESALSKRLKINSQAAQTITQYLGRNLSTKVANTLAKLTLSLNSLQRPATTISEIKNKIDIIKGRFEHANVDRLQTNLVFLFIEKNNVEELEKVIKDLESENKLTPLLLSTVFTFYCSHDKIDKALEIKEKIKAMDSNFQLSKSKLVDLAHAFVRANRFEDAINYLKDNHSVVEEDPYKHLFKSWQLLDYLAEQKDAEKVLQMTNTLVENNIVEPSAKVLGSLIKVQILNNDFEGALKEFERCCTTYRATPYSLQLMKDLITKEDASRLQWLADLGTRIHGETNILHDLVIAFIECGRIRQARQILKTPGLQSKPERLDKQCKRYVKEGKPEYLENLLEASKELPNLDRSNIYHHLMVSYCDLKETDKALGLWTLLQEEGEIPSEKFLIHLATHLKAQGRDVPFVIPEPKNSAKTEPKPEKRVLKKQPIINTENQIIDSLIKSNNINEAVDIVLKSKKDTISINKLKQIIKTLATNGDVERIRQLEGHIQTSYYFNQLFFASFISGNGVEYGKGLIEVLKNTVDKEDFEQLNLKYPHCKTIKEIMEHPELFKEYKELAMTAASKGYHAPANHLWQCYIINGQYTEADALWEQHLKNLQNMIMYKSILGEAEINNKPELLVKLLELLKKPNASQNSLGYVYSRLLKIYASSSNTEKTKEILNQITESGLNDIDSIKNIKKKYNL